MAWDHPSSPVPLNPAEFRRPRGNRATRFLYVANCGRGRGDTPESVLASLRQLVPDIDADGLHVGNDGVSYVSFATPALAEQVRARVAASLPWVVKFAEHAEVTSAGPPIPDSVSSTADVMVPGLEIVPEFVTEAEAQDLLAHIDAEPWDTTIKRRVQHYAHSFDYAQLRLSNGGCNSSELPPFCLAVVKRLSDMCLLPHPVDQLTINEYQPGVGIAFHVDAHSAFEDGIAALTLGSGIVMELRQPQPDGSGKVSVGKHHRLAPPPEDGGQVVQKNVWLPANSLLILRGEARYRWQHGIAWRKTDSIVEGEAVPRGRRVSLTLRTARHRPCDCLWPAMCDAQNPEAHILPSRVKGYDDVAATNADEA